MVSGGKRDGAGRPELDQQERKVTLCIRIAPELRKKLQKASQSKNESIGGIISQLIAKHL